IVRHIDYLINIMGEDHVALGSDFDGITLPDELGDVAGLPRLINTLRASGYDQLVLDKLLWRNWLRVLKNVWQQ
ncbi:membrane dipeptidase, partial [Escherichia coli]